MLPLLPCVLPSAFCSPVELLLEEAGYSDLVGPNLLQSQLGTLLCNLGLLDNSLSFCSSVVIDEMNVRLNGSMSIGTAA
jgi:hypothetical protein